MCFFGRILTSYKIYYWTHARQHGIYLLNCLLNILLGPMIDYWPSRRQSCVCALRDSFCLISPFQLFLLSLLFAVLFLVTSGVMADFLSNLYDRGWHRLQPNRKYTDVLTASVVSSHSSFFSFEVIFTVGEFHNFSFSLSFIFMSVIYFLYLRLFSRFLLVVSFLVSCPAFFWWWTVSWHSGKSFDEWTYTKWGRYPAKFNMSGHEATVMKKSKYGKLYANWSTIKLRHWQIKQMRRAKKSRHQYLMYIAVVQIFLLILLLLEQDLEYVSIVVSHLLSLLDQGFGNLYL